MPFFVFIPVFEYLAQGNKLKAGDTLAYHNPHLDCIENAVFLSLKDGKIEATVDPDTIDSRSISDYPELFDVYALVYTNQEVPHMKLGMPPTSIN